MDLGGLGILDAGLEGVAEGHEFIDFGYYAVLFENWWNSNKASAQLSFFLLVPRLQPAHLSYAEGVTRPSFEATSAFSGKNFA